MAEIPSSTMSMCALSASDVPYRPPLLAMCLRIGLLCVMLMSPSVSLHSKRIHLSLLFASVDATAANSLIVTHRAFQGRNRAHELNSTQETDRHGCNTHSNGVYTTSISMSTV